MKRLVMVLMLILADIGSAYAEQEPSMLIYMSPDKYNHPVLVGVAPLYTHWVYQAEIAENAAFNALSARYTDIGICDGTRSADIVAWVKPKLVYNPAVQTYYAKLKLELHLGDGSPIGTYKAVGHEDGSITSVYTDDEVARAYDDAMRQIMDKMQADSALQNRIHNALAANFKRNPCGMNSVLTNPKNKE
jgi:hypothetical protein